MVYERRGSMLSSVCKGNASSTGLSAAKQAENAEFKRAENPEKQKASRKRSCKPEDIIMADVDFTSFHILVEAAAHLAEKREQKRKRVNKAEGNPPHPRSQNFYINKARGDFKGTALGKQYIGMKQGEEAILNDKDSSERSVELDKCPPKRLKATTTVQPKETPKSKSKDETIGEAQVHQSSPRKLRIQTSGANSMVPYEIDAADSGNAAKNTGSDLLKRNNDMIVPARTKIGRHGIAVYNASTRDWTAYIWDGKRFYIDDTLKTPTEADYATTLKNNGADLLEIWNGVCLPDSTKLGLLGINFYKRIGRWTAHIWDGKQYYVGSYASATEAAKAYDKASLKHFGASAAQLNYKGIYDYSEDLKEMATLTCKQFRDLLNQRAKLSKHVLVSEGVTRCPEGRFEVRFKLQADKKWKFLGRFENLEHAKRWYQMVSRWYEKQATCERS